MAGIGYATLSVIPSAKGFGSKLSAGIDPEMSKAGKSASRFFDSSLSKSGTSLVRNTGRALGGVLLGGFGAAVVGIGAVIKTGFDEAKDASAMTAQLTAGIKSTGNAAGVSVGGLDGLAKSIQGFSGQTDDSIMAAEGLLLTFTKIKNKGPDKIFDQATLAAANMAARFGGDASGSAIQLGKALQDPVKGVASLARVGVIFDAGQKKSIKAMVEAGDTMGAQKIILAELNKEFGGSAKAAGTSLPGQLAIAKRSFEEVSESVVTGLMPVVVPAITDIAKTVTTKVIPAVQNFVTEFKNGTGAGGTFRDVLTTTGTVLGAVAGFIKKNSDFLIPFIGVILAVVGVIRVWVAIQTALNVVMALNPIGLVVIAVAALVAVIILIATKTTWFQTAWEYMSRALGKAWQWLWNTILAPVIRFMLNGFASITGGIATMLDALSNIPGFGWAKDAADKMATAAGKAKAMADGIKDIPPKKAVTVAVGSTSTPAARVAMSLPANTTKYRLIDVGATFSPAALMAMSLPAGTTRYRLVVPGMASGGPVPGVGTRDTVPTMLTPGEFVVRRDGSNIADALNHFGAKAAPAAGVTQYIYPTPGMSEEQVGAASARQIEWAMRGNR